MNLRLASPGRPTRLIDLGPASPGIHTTTYGSRPANVVGDMLPILTHAHSDRGEGRAPLAPMRVTRKPLAVRVRVRAVCGAPMRQGETCGRTASHADLHRSRALMDEDARARRGTL